MLPEALQPDLVRRLRSAEGHMRGIIGMVEAGASCQEILHQARAVRGALDEIKWRLIEHHLRDCLRNDLADPDPAVRERAIADVITVYGLASAGPSRSNGKERL